jgi:fumarylacetoacetase
LQNENVKPLPAVANVMVSECTLHLPLRVENFTDFSCSEEHNLRAGEVLLGTTNLPPAFYHYPLGYTGRASSVRLTGTPVQRPLGLSRDPSNPGKVVFGPERNLDFELGIGCVIGQAVEGGTGCSVEKASEHIFGLLLLNDWSGKLYLLRFFNSIRLRSFPLQRDLFRSWKCVH